MTANRTRRWAWLCLAALPACSAPGWRNTLAERLPAFGHRNWIGVVDSAYPEQARASIETVVTRADQLEVVRAVLGAAEGARHVRPVVVLDSELERVPEADAPGIGAYRAELARVLEGRPVERRPHEEILRELEAAGALVDVLVLKTDLALPYTSVFVRLECGYWGDEAERRLRAAGPAR
jgi:hypothetical protein